MVDFYGFDVGKYTSPMDWLGMYILYIYRFFSYIVFFIGEVTLCFFRCFFFRTGIKWNVLRWRVALRIKSRCEFVVGEIS